MTPSWSRGDHLFLPRPDKLAAEKQVTLVVSFGIGVELREFAGVVGLFRRGQIQHHNDPRRHRHRHRR
jgi:hypothetical protein